METGKQFTTPTSIEDFGNENIIRHTYDNGSRVSFVLLKDGRVARIREGKGTDCEKADMEARGDMSKYMSSLMSSVITVGDKPMNMYDLGDLPLKDYTTLKVEFAELNF